MKHELIGILSSWNLGKIEKLGVKVMIFLDWTVHAFVDARNSAEAFLQPDSVESIQKVLDGKGWFGSGGRVRQYTTRRLAQIEAASIASTAIFLTMPTTTWGTVLKEGARSTKQSEQNFNTLLNGVT